MSKKSNQCRSDQPHWNPNQNKLHKSKVPQVDHGDGKRSQSTKNDKR